jgi:hypothetical protein
LLPVEHIQAGQALDLGQGALLKVLCVGKRGGILLLEWRSFRLLLSDGGYAPLNPPEWIARWRPQVVLLSVAAGDAQGRPDPQVLQSVKGRTLLRTDQNGWVRLSTDGERIWVEVERP